MTIPSRVIKIIAARSGGICALCNIPLTAEDKDCGRFLGEYAHIYPQESDGPRCEDIIKDGIQRDFIDSDKNLMLLCPNCHTKIDKKPVKTYTVKYLQEKKKQHEQNVKQKLETETLKMTIAELEIICKKIISSEKDSVFYGVTDFNIIGIQEKIDKNKLSSVVEDIKLGLMQANFIKDYLSKMNEIDPLFTYNLVESFKKVYSRLSELYKEDELYYGIMDEVCPDYRNLPLRSAANAVVVYLFHECEIFEK